MVLLETDDKAGQPEDGNPDRPIQEGEVQRCSSDWSHGQIGQ